MLNTRPLRPRQNKQISTSLPSFTFLNRKDITWRVFFFSHFLGTSQKLLLHRHQWKRTVFLHKSVPVIFDCVHTCCSGMVSPCCRTLKWALGLCEHTFLLQFQGNPLLCMPISNSLLCSSFKMASDTARWRKYVQLHIGHLRCEHDTAFLWH